MIMHGVTPARVAAFLAAAILGLLVATIVFPAPAVATLAPPTLIFDAGGTPQARWVNKTVSIPIWVQCFGNPGGLSSLTLSCTYSIDGEPFASLSMGTMTTASIGNGNYEYLRGGELRVGPGPNEDVPLSDGKHTIVFQPTLVEWTGGDIVMPIVVQGTPQSFAAWIDTTPPVCSSFTINDPTDSQSQAVSTAVKLYSTASDANSGVLVMQVADTLGISDTPKWYGRPYLPVVDYLITSTSTDPHNYDHFVWVRFTDNAYNISEPFVRHITNDVDPPQTPIEGSDNGWHSVPVTLTLAPRDNVPFPVTTYSQIDGGAIQSVVLNPQETTTVVVRAPSDGSGDGVHTVTAWSVDTVGNVEDKTNPNNTVAVMIDTKAPATLATKAASVIRGRVASLRYKVTDTRPGSPTATVTIKIKNSHGRVVKNLKLGTQIENIALVAHFKCRLAAGKYRYCVHATDQAGNKQANVASNKLIVK